MPTTIATPAAPAWHEYSEGRFWDRAADHETRQRQHKAAKQCY